MSIEKRIKKLEGRVGVEERKIIFVIWLTTPKVAYEKDGKIDGNFTIIKLRNGIKVDAAPEEIKKILLERGYKIINKDNTEQE